MTFADLVGAVWDGRDNKDHFTISERRALCQLAYVHTETADADWNTISARDRVKLVNACMRAVSLGSGCSVLMLRAQDANERRGR